VSARTALGASLNVPAVRTLVMVSPDAFHKQLKAVGLPLKESGDYYGYSLALGSSEVSLLSLTNAYRTLANGGRYSAPSLAKNPKPVFRPALDARAPLSRPTSWPTRWRARAPSAPTASWPPASGRP
jgi:penicillin-binding protein 1C